MQRIDSMVPGFEQALDHTTGARSRWNALASLSGPFLADRDRALVSIAVAQHSGCDYARWVMACLGSRAGLTGEDIALASFGTGRGAHEKSVVRGAGAILRGAAEGSEALKRAVAVALLACRILRSLAPSTHGADARRGA